MSPAREVHDDGEIYAAIGWSLFKRFAGRKDALFDYLVDGMNYTPAQPTYEQMRDGILASVANGDNPADECLVWQAFAQFGVGVNAKGLAKGQTKAVISESFALPAILSAVETVVQRVAPQPKGKPACGARPRWLSPAESQRGPCSPWGTWLWQRDAG